MRIDEKKGVIYDVLVLGRRAKNKRHYTTEAMEDAVRRRTYERLPVYIGPHKKSRFAKRSPHDHAGELRNVRLAKDGVRADLHYNRASKGGKLALEVAQRFPESFGFSHHADVAGYEENGEKYITRIVEASVVDLIKDPATTLNVFESVEGQYRQRQLSVVIEREVRKGLALIRRAMREAALEEEATEAAAEAVEWNRQRKAQAGRRMTRGEILAEYVEED